jgi:hypothetical protein
LAIWVFERCPRFSRPISLDPSYIYRYVGGLLSFVLFKHHLDPSSYYSFGGPSFLHTIHVLVIQLAWTPSYIYIYTLGAFFPLCYPKTIWTHHHIIIRLGAFFPSYHPKETSQKSNAFLKHMKISTLAGFMCLPLSIGDHSQKQFQSAT